MSHEKKMKAVSPLLQQAIHISSIVGGVGTVIFCIWAYQAGILHSKETLSAFIQQAGIWGPPLFIFLQILQTVVPIIPGACAIIFYLVRLYGAPFVQSMVSKRTYDKYIGWLDEGNRFDRFFIFMMIWPVSPADFLCMLAALTKMSFKRYMTIIILTKPFTLVVYTYGLTYIIDYFWQMFG